VPICDKRSVYGITGPGKLWFSIKPPNLGRQDIFPALTIREVLELRDFSGTLISEQRGIGGEEQRYLYLGPAKILGILRRKLKIPASGTNITILGNQSAC
jgi:hypothetical protein